MSHRLPYVPERFVPRPNTTLPHPETASLLKYPLSSNAGFGEGGTASEEILAVLGLLKAA